MPKIVDHDHRRRELAAAAARVIAKQGAESATVRAIAEEAGCSTGVLQHYFSDKNELIVHAVEWANERLVERILATFRSLGSVDDLKDLVRAALPLDRRSELEWRVRLHFWGYASSRPELRRYHRKHIDGWRSSVAGFFAAAQRNGVIRSDLDAATVGATLVGLVFGLGVQLLFDRRPERLASVAAIDEYVASLVPSRE